MESHQGEDVRIANMKRAELGHFSAGFITVGKK